MTVPRVMIAGLSGGAGKTIVSLGVTRAFALRGLAVKPFKKGPDYIDAAWLALAARRPATNLDPYLLPPEVLFSLFAEKAAGADVAVIEGNRGLFDGKDVEGSCSSAQLARQLEIPVVLVVDATKMTRTVAAVVQGCAHFEPGLRLAGVILNRTAGERHRAVLRQALETYTDIPVLGMLPKISQNPIPERHMGLVSSHEYEGETEALDTLADVAAEWVDLDRVLDLANRAPSLPEALPVPWPGPVTDNEPVIGYVRDAALWFYYEENLEALERAGARLVRLSLLDETPWPELDGLYLGGGFPETLAAELSANAAARARVRALADAGLPIYAECGGFMYLGRDVEYQERLYEMSGVLPLSTRLCARPQGLGYTEALSVADNPYHPKGVRVLGHEFHYSRCVGDVTDELEFCLRLSRGEGIRSGADGVRKGNVYAGYNHIHALGAPHWAPNFVRAAAIHRGARNGA